MDAERVLGLAASVEADSEHPLARAIVDGAKQRGVETRPASDFEALAGRGARAKVHGHDVFVGGPRLLAGPGPGAASAGRGLGSAGPDRPARRRRWRRGRHRGRRGRDPTRVQGSRRRAARARRPGGDDHRRQPGRGRLGRAPPRHRRGRRAGPAGRQGRRGQALPGGRPQGRHGRRRRERRAGAGDGRCRHRHRRRAPTSPSSRPASSSSAATHATSSRAIELSRATYSKMVQNLVWATGYNLVAIPVAMGVLVPWGIDLLDGRRCHRDEPLDDHRGGQRPAPAEGPAPPGRCASVGRRDAQDVEAAVDVDHLAGHGARQVARRGRPPSRRRPRA